MAAPIFKFKNVRVPLTDTSETLAYAVEVGQGDRGLDVGVLPDEVSSVILTVQCSNKRKFVPNKNFTNIVNTGDKIVFDTDISALSVNTPVMFSNFLAEAGDFITGVTYTIVDVGSTDFTLIGAASNAEGVSFLCDDGVSPPGTLVGTGSGTARPDDIDGQIDPNVTYYVKTIDTGTNSITVSATLVDGVAGSTITFGSNITVSGTAAFDSTVQISAKIKDLNTNNSVNLVKDYPILPQNAFDPLNGNLVLTSKLGLYIQANAKDVDVVVSLLEIANATAA